MTQLSKTAFINKYTGIFADNGIRAISEADIREFKDDIADSFQTITGATAITSWKDPCLIATTGNITLSGEQTIDGVLTNNSRVLVKDQSSTLQNGIYVSGAGAWTRSTDADSAAELEGAAVGVTQGTTNKNSVWLQTTDNITLETSAIVWQTVGFTAESISKAVVNVSSSEILALNTVPKELVPAPGANRAILVHDIFIIYNYGTAEYQTNTTLSIVFGTTGNISNIANLINQTVDKATKAAYTTSFAYELNQSLNVTMVGAPTNGDGTLKFIVYYTIEDL